ncbi:hypothetical protein BU26DRAFT_187543 [Trematosphaeria pertusa]|uniref:Uncharacterized protein n=1 Tax=Trematosphaeria pertusa TaxID=390896 RepID=A0A6A6HRS6_9PLEO|nr:uncharacterized protein BU26DRAFT_187543 [Trematosphaeria pertusa]KAF2240711.1 hypothetical protein BU26DRAFT_187543 [Trematosphaeria pertusa]
MRKFASFWLSLQLLLVSGAAYPEALWPTITRAPELLQVNDPSSSIIGWRPVPDQPESYTPMSCGPGNTVHYDARYVSCCLIGTTQCLVSKQCVSGSVISDANGQATCSEGWQCITGMLYDDIHKSSTSWSFVECWTTPWTWYAASPTPRSIASAIPTSTTDTTSTTATSSPSPTPATATKPHGGSLSAGAWVGVAFGILGGIAAIPGSILACIKLRRWWRRHEELEETTT